MRTDRYACAGLLALVACGSGEPTTPPVSRLSFAVGPSTRPATVVMAPSVLVVLLDGYGNPVRGATDRVTIAIGANPTGGTLRGTTTVKAVYGIASFKDLSIDQTGDRYTLVASSGALPSVTSEVFGVFDTLSPPVHLDSLQLDSTTLTIGGPAVAYGARVSNTSLGTLSSVYVQAYIDQGAVSQAAGGSNVSCGPQSGDLLPGNCPFGFELVVLNSGGTLAPGPATARFELRQWLNQTQSALLDSVAQAVTLTQ